MIETVNATLDELALQDDIRHADLIRTPGQAPRLSIACERLRPLDLKQFLQLSIKAREMLLDPILPEKGLAMLYAARGTGKTHVALGIAFAVATGTEFLKWKAPKPRRVLLIDGEMPAAALQERLASIVASQPDVQLDPNNIQILAGDLIEAGGIGNLASPDVQAEIDRWLDGVDLLALDNLSSLTAVIRDNDAESWGPIQEWLLKLRRRGISVLIVHHAGKGGQQRGTSRREDVLDTSISLRHPADYTPVEGARFEVHLEKARGVHGEAARPFEARLDVRDGRAMWTTRELEDANRARVQALLDDGLSVRDIADETGIPKSTVHRIKKPPQRREAIMPGDPDLLTLAHAVLRKQRDSAWDSRGTPPKNLSQSIPDDGTVKSESNQQDNTTVPLSHTLGRGTVGHPEDSGTLLGTVVGQHYGSVLTALRSKCPELVETERWDQAARDADSFLAKWGPQAQALGWTARELFGLHPVPMQPASSFRRLARYDSTGLIWLLQGRPVIALTETEAAIQSAGAVVMYRKHNKPALGPLGDSLDDMGPCP
jgi:hypothetical protein